MVVACYNFALGFTGRVRTDRPSVVWIIMFGVWVWCFSEYYAPCRKCTRPDMTENLLKATRMHAHTHMGKHKKTAYLLNIIVSRLHDSYRLFLIQMLKVIF